MYCRVTGVVGDLSASTGGSGTAYICCRRAAGFPRVRDAIYRHNVVHDVDVNRDSGWTGEDEAQEAFGFLQQFWLKSRLSVVWCSLSVRRAHLVRPMVDEYMLFAFRSH